MHMPDFASGTNLFLNMLSDFFRPRARAAGIHLGLSALVAAIASLLVFLVWYPSPYATIAGGTHLFLLLVLVDVVMGPALTAVVASAGKSRRELARDLAIIVTLQVVAFGYGLYSVALARPVALAFEIDLLRLVSAADLDPADLKDAPLGLRDLSWRGPRLLAVVKPSDPAEQFRSVQLGLAGIPLAMMPRYWRDYAPYADVAWRAARPVQALLSHYPAEAEAVGKVAAAAGQAPQALRFLPVQAHKSSWVALIAGPDARIVGYLPLDGFF